MDVKNFFVCALSEKRSGLKTGVENDIFGLKYGQDLENRAAHPHQEFPGVPLPPPGGETRLKVRKNMIKTFIPVQNVKFLS